MDIQNIISELQSKFGGKIDVGAIKEHLKVLIQVNSQYQK